MTTHFGFPFRVADTGRTANENEDAHVRALIEQVIFTSPGERVNRPTFGSGLQSLVFAPAGEVLSATIQQLVQSALQQWLGDRIQVDSVNVAHEEASLSVTVSYLVRRTQERRSVELVREG